MSLFFHVLGQLLDFVVYLLMVHSLLYFLTTKFIYILNKIIKNMKYLSKFESKLNDEIGKIFKRAIESGSVSVGDDFFDEASEYYIYDDYFIYDNLIFKYSSRPSGDWYHTEIVKMTMTKNELLEKIEKEIDKLENAYNKLYNIDI